jgi:hypothetical protein
MIPPEKIYIRFDKKPTAYTFGDAKWDDTPFPFQKSIEYHLAPVWHDAVKEPPKESCYCIAQWKLDERWIVSEAWYYKPHDKWYSTRDEEIGRIYPVKWQPFPLPLPPERSGE